jgi:pantetheine-phosphate adenylyltransferase
MAANPLYSFLRSSLVKEIAAFGGDVTSLIPATIEQKLRAKVAAR